jgi:hypothetical protein
MRAYAKIIVVLTEATTYMARLPQPGSDDGTWGNILNDFLAQAHNPDGTLKQLSQSQIANLTADLAARTKTSDLASVATSGLYSDLVNKPSIPTTAADVGAVPTIGLDDATSTLIANGSSTTTGSLRAAYGRADPVLANFVYDGSGNLTSYTEDGLAIVLTYNTDGTVATSKRGTNAVQTYTYSGGNLVGVA